jgi:predicted metal-dependent HD superfamily phosphohydrolase
MDSETLNIAEVWRRLFEPFAHGSEILQRVRAAYGQEGRYYHTLEHISEMTAILMHRDSHATDRNALLFACLYHDLVYDAQRHDNEEASVRIWSEEAILLGLAPALIEMVSELILATRKHLPEPDTMQTRRFLDADLAVLGSAPDRYARYAADVRREYAHVPEDEYREGRAKVLEKFLLREVLYFTPEMQQKFDRRARLNMSAEIERLSGQMSPG